MLPKALREILKPKSSIKIKRKSDGKSFLNISQLLDFDWQIAIGDTLMDEAEFKKLLQKSDGLIKHKSRYIYVNQQDLEKIHKHFSSTKELSAFQMLRAALSGEYQGAAIGLTDEVREFDCRIDQFQRNRIAERDQCPTASVPTSRFFVDVSQCENRIWIGLGG